MKKLVRDIIAGDKVMADDNSVYTVDTIQYGMWPGARIINFTNGKWSQLHGGASIQLAT